MKKKSLLIILSLGSIFLFGQEEPRITKQTNQIWNADKAFWQLQDEYTWVYDDQGREVYYLFELGNIYQFDFYFNPYRFSSTETDYDGAGNIILSESRSWNDTLWSSSKIQKQFDSKNRILEEVTYYDASDQEEGEIPSWKITYEYSDQANTELQETYYWNATKNNWYKNHSRYFEYSDEGCVLINQYERLNWQTGEIINKYKTINTYIENCLLHTSERHELKESSNGTLEWELTLLEEYEYANDNKFKRIKTYNAYSASGEWELSSIFEEEVDEEGRLLRNYTNYVNWVPSNESEQIYTYTERGELFTQSYYHTDYQTNDFVLYRKDSLVYDYQDDKLLRKVHYWKYPEFSSNYLRTETAYDHYCNDLVRQMKTENLPSVYRTLYEYETGDDCPEDPQKTILAFPNPIEDQLTIQSELLREDDASILIYSMTGQTAYSQQVPGFTEQMRINLPKLPAGSYVLCIRSGKDVVSRKLIKN